MLSLRTNGFDCDTHCMRLCVDSLLRKRRQRSSITWAIFLRAATIARCISCFVGRNIILRVVKGAANPSYAHMFQIPRLHEHVYRLCQYVVMYAHTAHGVVRTFDSIERTFADGGNALRWRYTHCLTRSMCSRDAWSALRRRHSSPLHGSSFRNDRKYSIFEMQSSPSAFGECCPSVARRIPGRPCYVPPRVTVLLRQAFAFGSVSRWGQVRVCRLLVAGMVYAR